MSALVSVVDLAVSCRDDGINWAVLVNSDEGKDGKAFTDALDPLLHKTADEIKTWPEIDLFSEF
jgi:hypothetical protein